MRRTVGLLVAVALTLTGLAACGQAHDTPPRRESSDTKAPKIGVILPDTTSSPRWEAVDRAVFLETFQAGGVHSEVRNAHGDKASFVSIADELIAGGATVLIIVSLDPQSGKAVIDKARAHGARVIDYDRLTVNGGADYYVSFDDTEVGVLQGQGLVDCLTQARAAARPVIAELNGPPGDHSAAALKLGYDSVLQSKYDSGVYVKGPDQPVPDWNATAATTIFGQMMTQARNNIGGVVAANDELANAAIGVLRKLGKAGKVPVSGQDTTVTGLQNILTGDQCMTVYKPIRQEAEAAAAVALSMARGEFAGVSQTVRDLESGAQVPATLVTPRAITKANVKDVVADGYVSKDDLCTTGLAAACALAGIR